MVVTVMFYFGIKNIISKDIQENIVFLSPKFVDTNYLLALFPNVENIVNRDFWPGALYTDPPTEWAMYTARMSVYTR